MEWYLKVLRQYADFNGRARRKEYWMFTLFHMIAAFTTAFIGGLLAEATDGASMALYFIYLIGTIIPGLAVTVRRLHDTNKSGWMILVSLIPLIGSIWLLVLMVTEGDHGPNEYGPDPKEEIPYDQVIDEIGQDPFDRGTQDPF